MALEHAIVSRTEWLAARRALLEKEKAFTAQRDELNAERRALPWVAVPARYVFETESGQKTLADLFDGRSQLIVYHFMFGPDWAAGCPHCSFWADSFDRNVIHIAHRDATLVAVSHAPLAKLIAYRKRMGWSFAWVSSYGSQFNFDFGVAFTPQEVAQKKAVYNYRQGDPFVSEREGASVFLRDAAGNVFHTYSTYARGIDLLNAAYNYIDLLPKGRDEGDRNQYWVRRRDEY